MLSEYHFTTAWCVLGCRYERHVKYAVVDSQEEVVPQLEGCARVYIPNVIKSLEIGRLLGVRPKHIRHTFFVVYFTTLSQ
jgi:hypothetical protein